MKRSCEELGITAELHALCGHGFSRGFLVSLASRFVSGAELIFLLIHNVATFIHPTRSLFTSFTRPSTNVLSTLLRSRTQLFARLTSRTRCIKDSD